MVLCRVDLRVRCEAGSPGAAETQILTRVTAWTVGVPRDSGADSGCQPGTRPPGNVAGAQAPDRKVPLVSLETLGTGHIHT